MVDPLSELLVIDLLEVGPSTFGPRRVTTPYRVVRGGVEASTKLIYKYPETVFTKNDPVSQNLASMIGAQLALNYGLFCKEIRFVGPFDGTDRALLRDMAQNTAREIYVKKILEPNPFIASPVSWLTPNRRQSYLQSTITFSDRPAKNPKAEPWLRPETERRIAVLSSGGKDSLLSHGLLDEMGLEVHAMFANEAGRHWFTALNGYRHLSETKPQTTARVWTNSDRVFAWMLRQLPFIRKDFARVRSDEYPIRLWTVAVFLFGVLPLMRQRGIDRLVIGDEYDTSVRSKLHGITHYNGLFDQSRFFDAALSKYLHKKGYGTSVFSVLRPMSELLIQRTLMARYPKLFACQMSCHATHNDGRTIHPCGKCEKCRRIVAMVVADGGDPSICGYTSTQVEQCLAAVSEHGVHHEFDLACHLAWILVNRGLIPHHSPFGRTASPRAQVVKLRIDPQASPVTDVPTDLRPGLFRLLLEQADGAVMRRGKSWVAHDLLAPEALGATDRFPRAFGQAGTIPHNGTHRLGELTWPQAERRFREVDVALLPVGATEQHGRHLPLDIDIWDAVYQADQVAKRCTDPRPLVLPGIHYGVSYHHDDFAGTISITPETLSKLVYEVGMAAARNGVRKLVIINGHGGNIPALQFAAQMINRDAHIFTCVDTGETSDAEASALLETTHDVHAGEYETSMALATRPELVYMDQAQATIPNFSSRYLDFGSNASVSWFVRTSRISNSGVIGDPTKATAEKGNRLWQITIDNMVELVEHLKTASLDEIHRRRE